jgi:N-acetylneuraminic acid mutarotase
MSQELRNTNKAVYGASTASINDTIFIYGGSYNVVPWDKEAMWSLTADLKLSQLKTDPFASPALMHSTLVNVKNDLYAFGGHEVEDKKRSIELIRYYRFNYDNMTWTPLQKQEEEKEVGPEERFSHTAVVTPDQERVYIYGGMNVSNGFSDLWEYKPGEDQWYKLFNVEPRCGHTASILR